MNGTVRPWQRRAGAAPRSGFAGRVGLRWARALLGLVAWIAGCGASGLAFAAGSGLPVQTWLTTGDKTHLLERRPDLVFGQRGTGRRVIEVDAGKRYQTMVGFGASLTDASAWLIQNHMSEAQRDALLHELFGRESGGVGFDFARLTIGASDFSRTHYTLDDRPAGETDMTLAHFSIDANRADVLPVIKRALQINPGLKIMASPWSPPAWMKTGGRLGGGTLRPDMYGVFTDYLLRYVDAYAAEGVPVFALTLQNEPHFATEGYPGMRLDPAMRSRLIGEHLGPLLALRGAATKLLEWDHNWDQPEAPLKVLMDPVARRYVSGVAWHCYEGEPRAQNFVHDAHPEIDAWFTECSGGDWKPHWPETLPWMVRNVVIGSTRGWARGVLMWNLALDENHGPHLGGCNDCRGVVTIDSKTGAVTRNLEYYALAHASKFVRAGAQRIDSSMLSTDGLDTVAFRNADDGSIVLIVCNSAHAARRISVRQDARQFDYAMPGEAIATFVWRP